MSPASPPLGLPAAVRPRPCSGVVAVLSSVRLDPNRRLHQCAVYAGMGAALRGHNNLLPPEVRQVRFAPPLGFGGAMSRFTVLHENACRPFLVNLSLRHILDA